jgi:capsular exopolysaccharide synthesis family protein
VLRRWVWLLALCPLMAVAGAGVVTLFVPPVYEAQVAVLVKPAQPLTTTDPGVSMLTADQISGTYAQLMTERPILNQVISDLHLHVNTEDLARQIKVTPQANTTIIGLAVDSTSAKLARDVANTVVDEFVAQTKRIQQQQSDQYTARIRAQIQRVDQSIAADQSRVDQLSQPNAAATLQQQTELFTLQQQLSAERSQYSSLVANLSDIEAQTARSTDNVVVISPAVLPERPVSPKPLLNLALALGGGLALAIGAVLVLERLDQSVKSDEQLAERTGLTAIGHIAYVAPGRRRGDDLVVLGEGHSQVAEAYRALRTNLLFSSLDREIRTVVVTSSVPNEGKSRTAANLAIVLAQAGHSTVLIDADFRRPSQHRIFGRIRNLGLSNMMLRDVPEAELIWPVEHVPNLSLIASGPTPPNPSELLGSAQLRSLLTTLRGRYRYVVIDTPPVNAVTDPTVLAAHADATILVIEQGITTYPAVLRASQALTRVGANVVGAVVNKLRSESGSYYQYYYYHYYGHQAGGNGQAQAPPDEAVAGPPAPGGQAR